MNSLRSPLSVLASVAVALLAAPAAHGQSSDPGINPVFNDASCVPSPAHPNPVVYLHGTGSDSNGFTDSAHFLRERGFCLWTLHYGANSDTIRNLVPGHQGLGPIEDSVDEISVFVDGVLATTGAAKVDLVGFSLGGTLTKAYIQGRDAASKVGRSVSLGATFRGTTGDGYTQYAGSALNSVPETVNFLVGASTPEQFEGSEFVSRITQMPDTSPGIIYTAFYTPSDTVATPNSTSVLVAVDGADVANINVEETCGRPFAHRDLPRSTETVHLIHWGLTRQPGNTVATRENCES